MTYTLVPRDPDRPFDPFVWNLNPVTLETTVDDIELRMESAHSLSVTVQKQKHYVNLTALAQGQGESALLVHLSGHKEKFNHILAAISKLQEEYRIKNRYTQITLILPTLTSDYQYCMEVTANEVLDQTTIVNDFPEAFNNLGNAKLQRSKDQLRYRFRTWSRDTMVSQIKKFEVGGFVYKEAKQYLDFCKEAVNFRNFDFSPSSSKLHWLWFQQELDALSPKEFEKYVQYVRENKYAGIPSIVVLTEVSLSPRVKLMIDYLKQKYKARMIRHIEPMKSPALSKFLERMRITLLCLMVVVMLPVIVPVLILKGLAELLNFIPVTTYYSSPTLPAIYSLMLGTRISDNTHRLNFLGAIFDIPAQIMLNLWSLITLPILILPFLIMKVPEYIHHVRGIKRLEKESDSSISNLNSQHPLFKPSQKIQNFRTISKGLRDITDRCTQRRCCPNPIAVQAESIDSSTENPGEFTFFPALPRQLQEKIIDHAIDNELNDGLSDIPTSHYSLI